MKKLALSLIFFALLLQCFAYYVRAARIEPFLYYFYVMVWWSYIVLIDSLSAFKTKRFLVLNKRLPYLIMLSAAFWCLFELLNLRLQNWFYVNLPPSTPLRFAGYAAAFGTVIPAIYGTYRLLLAFFPRFKTKPVRLSGYGTYAIPLGLLCLLFALAFPLYLFCLAWVFPIFIADGYGYRLRSFSFAADLQDGNSSGLLAAIVSGMICGVLWEFWNYWSVVKWIYTVPFFEWGKLFEMPVPGYLGFPLFALGTVAFFEIVSSAAGFRRVAWALFSAAIPLCLVSFLLMDRYTVFSYTAPVQDLPFLPQATRESLARSSIETSYAIDPRMLNEEERGELDLMHLKGLGLSHLAALRAHGVRTIPDLSRLDAKTLSSIIREPNLRRVRVYLDAARAESTERH